MAWQPWHTIFLAYILAVVRKAMKFQAMGFLSEPSAEDADAGKGEKRQVRCIRPKSYHSVTDIGLKVTVQMV